MKVHARVQITVDFPVGSPNWNEHTSVEALHREAREIGLKRITELCQRYVTIVGTPSVVAVIAEEQKR